ncbi:hypothetical protein RFI_14284, partial [Reticulomyxa filosa]
WIKKKVNNLCRFEQSKKNKRWKHWVVQIPFFFRKKIEKMAKNVPIKQTLAHYIFQAMLAQKCHQYKDMRGYMKELVNRKTTALTELERNLFVTSYQQEIMQLKKAYEIVTRKIEKWTQAAMGRRTSTQRSNTEERMNWMGGLRLNVGDDNNNDNNNNNNNNDNNNDTNEDENENENDYKIQEATSYRSKIAKECVLLCHEGIHQIKQHVLPLVDSSICPLYALVDKAIA